ncbi:MAG: hypothetical protein H7X95_14085 [Deltaproteobacteria bacterium]|nr:hypothetical protein [Deltaproteobacteria bacterium]
MKKVRKAECGYVMAVLFQELNRGADIGADVRSAAERLLAERGAVPK